MVSRLPQEESQECLDILQEAQYKVCTPYLKTLAENGCQSPCHQA